MSRDEEVGQKDEDKFRDCEKFKVRYRFQSSRLHTLTTLCDYY